MIISPYVFATGGGGGSYPTYLSATGSNFPTPATSHLVVMPATVNAGDLLMMQIATIANGAVTTPSGWTLMSSVSLGAVQYVSWYYKVAAGTEGGTTVTVTVGLSCNAAALVHRIQAGTYSGAPEIANVATGNTANPDPPSLSPSWGSAATLWIAAFSGRNPGSGTSVYPFANGNTRSASGATSDNSQGIAASCWENNTTASRDPGTFTNASSSARQAHTVAVRPA